MNTQPKKFLIFYILDILKRCTDEDHRLSQKQIGEILEREYEMKADRKSIRRNLLDLIDLGYDVGCSQSVRVKPDGEEEVLLTDWYLNQESPTASYGSSSTGCCFPSTSLTDSVGSW